jgi:O-acetyl-ADP-ribose deacetylase (regulator of RNase III)/molybdopterin-biosynthesis enzyme MoeA-like protein
MNTEAIVNTANDHVSVGTGCDHAVYMAAGYDELLKYREEKIGFVPEGDVFITPGFALPAKYIIHAVSPFYNGGNEGEEEKLRSCYRKSLQLAKENNIKSISFPLISTGGFGYPKEEGMRIAVDEINSFLLQNEMDIYLVVFDDNSTRLGSRIYPDLEAYIDRRYVRDKNEEEYGDAYFAQTEERRRLLETSMCGAPVDSEPITHRMPEMPSEPKPTTLKMSEMMDVLESREPEPMEECEEAFDFEEQHESKLEERMQHLSDTFSEYLLYLIHDKNMENAEVWKRAIVDKKVFSKIKNNTDYHPQKLTALCLCMGAKLNLDESKDLLARAGYALSPCDKTDIIFSYFIENKIYDMIELDIQLEEHGLPCIIS